MKLGLRWRGVALAWAAAAPCFAQYGGPAILSRGQAPSAMSGGTVRFRPFVEAAATYDTGLAGIALNDQGQLAMQSSMGYNLGWGVSGARAGKRSNIGLNYRGSVATYNKQSAYDTHNLSQSLMLGVKHALTRHANFNLNSTAGMFSRDFGLLGLPQTVPFDPATTNIPVTDFFDNRTYYGSAQGGLTVQKTARLSFYSGGGVYLVRRRSTALHGTTGYSATGDVHYRLTRYNTIGAAYSYQNFSATRVSGSTDAHNVVGSFSRALTRRSEFSASAGVMHVETVYLQQARVDPVIAALLGIETTSEIRHRILWTPSVEGRLTRVFPRGIAFLAAGRGLTPGNGLLLSSIATRSSAGYVYTGLRRWSFRAQTSYDFADSIQNTSGSYRIWTGQTTVSRALSRRGLHWFASYSVRRYGSDEFAGLNRTIHQARVGLGFSPGDVPLRIW